MNEMNQAILRKQTNNPNAYIKVINRPFRLTKTLLSLQNTATGFIAAFIFSIGMSFIPASINEMLSYLLDAGALTLFAVITHLEKKSQPWENVAIAVYFLQEANKELPAYADDLTRIEAPDYPTLNQKAKSNLH